MSSISNFTPIGSLSGYYSFQGTYDGQGHTLTLDYGTAEAPIDAQFVAPFIETSADGDHQPTFCNLIIGGTIYEGYTGSEAHNVGGLIGHLFGTVAIDHCTSNVSINATSGAGCLLHWHLGWQPLWPYTLLLVAGLGVFIAIFYNIYEYGFRLDKYDGTPRTDL